MLLDYCSSLIPGGMSFKLLLLGARYSHSSLFMIRCVFLKEMSSQQADESLKVQLAVFLWLQIAAHCVSGQRATSSR